MRRLSYLLPALVVAALVVVGKPSWWAVALLLGGVNFAWDWLWGDRRLLLASYGLRQAAIGCALIVVGSLVARSLGMSLGELDATAKGLRRSEAFLYHLPAAGIGLLVYGLLIWSRAYSRPHSTPAPPVSQSPQLRGVRIAC